MRSSKRARNRTQSSDPSPDNGISIVQTQELWHGPLPHPQIVEEFRRLIPDAPERIFRQWEDQSRHRREYERRALEASIRKDRIGQFAAITFALVALAVVAFAIWQGQPWVAGVLGGSMIVAVVGAFLYERRSRDGK